MSSYRPPQRVIPARVLTSSEWLRGDFHLPRFLSMLEFLGQESPYLALTGVVTASGREELPFVAVRRSAALLVLPCCEERLLLLAAPRAVRPRRVVCMLPCGAITATVVVESPLRLSDWLALQSGFVVLRDVELGQPGASAPIALVNAGALLTVAELPAEVQPSADVIPLRRDGELVRRRITHPA
jgi:hypothetical protein